MLIEIKIKYKYHKNLKLKVNFWNVAMATNWIKIKMTKIANLNIYEIKLFRNICASLGLKHPFVSHFFC